MSTSTAFSTLSGALIDQINEYFRDEVKTCDSGVTPGGCGNTYLDLSTFGSLAGTGPYTIQSTSHGLNTTILQANPNYWGGLYQFSSGKRITPYFQTININNVPSPSDRTRSLEDAARTNQAVIADIDTDRLFDVANSTAWLGENRLVSTISNVSLYGPFTSYQTFFDAFVTNVTNPSTGTYYTFQPFADWRFRLAFADAANLNLINQQANNNLGQVAINAIPPGLPPDGSYNTTIAPIYSFNPSEVQKLLLDAMMHPLKTFTFVNGTYSPPGLFNNTFGCTVLNSNKQCDNPVSQTITLAYCNMCFDNYDQALFQSIASVINGISATYHMGLQVTLQAFSTIGSYLFGFLLGQPNGKTPTYMYAIDWKADYPWSLDFLSPLYAPNNFLFTLNNWNLTQMSVFYNDAKDASTRNNLAAVASATDQMNELANQQVLYLWTFYPYSFAAMTSNIQGVYHNPSLYGVFFASLYVANSPTTTASGNLFFLPIVAAIGISAPLLAAFLYIRSSKNKRKRQGLLPPTTVQSPSETLLLESMLEGGETNVQLALYVPEEAFVGSEFKIKFDLINTGNKPATLHEIEEMLPQRMSLISKQQSSTEKEITIDEADRVIHLHGRKLHPSQIESIVLAVKVDESGQIEFAPKIIYSDDQGKLFTRTSPHPIRFRVTKHRSQFKKWLMD